MGGWRGGGGGGPGGASGAGGPERESGEGERGSSSMGLSGASRERRIGGTDGVASQRVGRGEEEGRMREGSEGVALGEGGDES